jgi:hypothetical protein
VRVSRLVDEPEYRRAPKVGAPRTFLGSAKPSDKAEGVEVTSGPTLPFSCEKVQNVLDACRKELETAGIVPE